MVVVQAEEIRRDDGITFQKLLVRRDQHHRGVAERRIERSEVGTKRTVRILREQDRMIRNNVGRLFDDRFKQLGASQGGYSRSIEIDPRVIGGGEKAESIAAQTRGEWHGDEGLTPCIRRRKLLDERICERYAIGN